MSILHFDGTGWAYSKFYRAETTSKALLFCGGPSINKIDLSKVRGPGKTVFALNNTYPKIYPDYWIGMDDPACYNRNLFLESFPKIMRGGYQDRHCEGIPITNFYNVHFASLEKTDDRSKLLLFPSTLDKFVWHQNSFATTLHIILWMGFKEIYLIGCDLDFSNGDYHNGVQLTKAQRAWNKNLYDSLYNYIRYVKKLFDKTNIKLYSMSKDSRINNLLEYFSLEEVNDSIRLFPEGKLFHTSELESEK